MQSLVIITTKTTKKDNITVQIRTIVGDSAKPLIGTISRALVLGSFKCSKWS